jgi:hypothetical protein
VEPINHGDNSPERLPRSNSAEEILSNLNKTLEAVRLRKTHVGDEVIALHDEIEAMPVADRRLPFLRSQRDELRKAYRALDAIEDDVAQAVYEIGRNAKTSDDELQTWYANANVTAMQAGGHNKGDRNRRLADSYLAELRARGLEPDRRKGQFNGDGAS